MSTINTIHIDAPDTVVGLAALRLAYLGPTCITIGSSAKKAIEAAQQVVEQVVRDGRVSYGINTGFGQLAQTVIPGDRLLDLQKNLVHSHSAGVGEPLDDAVVRLTLVLKVASLARGRSGVRTMIVDTLNRLLEREIYPVIPSKGSVGASGDLAPLAHLAGVLIGEGQVRIQGEVVSASEGLRVAELPPLELGPREGLALLNGTQVSTALALGGLFEAEDLLLAAVVAGAMAVEASRSSHTPFDERIHTARGQRGQAIIAAAFRSFLTGSAINESEKNSGRVQDPYSVRCQPQVLGACLDLMRSSAEILEIEANAVTDNPLIFAESGDILSGGNFHAEPVGMAADVLALAIAEIGALSERRIAFLVDSKMSGLPPFLTEHSGLNSGFMIGHVTAAALASENKSLAHPASIDSIPTSANQEDHVSMATFAGRRLLTMTDNTAGILGVELLAAAQGLEFHHPLISSKPVMRVLGEIRSEVPSYGDDRALSGDIATMKRFIRSGRYRGHIKDCGIPSAPRS